MKKGYALALWSSALLSTTAILISYLTVSHGMPSLVLAFWRDVFTCAAVLPFVAYRLGPAVLVSRRDLPFLLCFGVVLAGFNIFWTLSVVENGAAIATGLVYCSVLFAAVLERVIFGQKIALRQAAVLPAVVLGCFLIAGVTFDGSNAGASSGLVTGLLSGLGYAGYSLMGREASRRGLDPWVSILYTFGFAAILLFLSIAVLSQGGSGVTEIWHLGRSWSAWGALVLLAAGPTVLGFGLYNASLAHLPAGIANLVLTTEPVFTAVLAWIFLAEKLSRLELAGGGIILAGVLITRLGDLPGKRMRGNLTPGFTAD